MEGETYGQEAAPEYRAFLLAGWVILHPPWKAGMKLRRKRRERKMRTAEWLIDNMVGMGQESRDINWLCLAAAQAPGGDLVGEHVA